LLCVPAFFFQCSRDLLFLPSFPTRRSSDLDIGQLRGVRRGARVDEDVPDALGHEHPPIGREGQVPRDREPGSNGRRGQSRHGTRDRKSTRLNSSHVSISYAVFCLKKKKKEE